MDSPYPHVVLQLIPAQAVPWLLGAVNPWPAAVTLCSDRRSGSGRMRLPNMTLMQWATISQKPLVSKPQGSPQPRCEFLHASALILSQRMQDMRGGVVVARSTVLIFIIY